MVVPEEGHESRRNRALPVVPSFLKINGYNLFFREKARCMHLYWLCLIKLLLCFLAQTTTHETTSEENSTDSTIQTRSAGPLHNSQGRFHSLWERLSVEEQQQWNIRANQRVLDRDNPEEVAEAVKKIVAHLKDTVENLGYVVTSTLICLICVAALLFWISHRFWYNTCITKEGRQRWSHCGAIEY